MARLFSRFSFCLFLLASAVAGLSPAHGFGIRAITINSIAPAEQKITIDGNLDDWRGIDPFTFNPLVSDSVLRSADDPALSAVLQNPPAVKVRICYDSTALYVALEWKDKSAGMNHTHAGDADHWAEGGEGFELHILTDQMLHVACWPADDGKALSIMARYNNEKDWREAGGEMPAAAVPSSDGSAYVEEIQIPWDALTQTRKLPADGKIEIAADFCFNALDAKMIESLRKGAMLTKSRFRGVPFCFLSSHPPQIGADGLPNTFEWGSLIAADSASGDKAVMAPERTSLRSMPMPEAETPPAMDGTLTGWDPASFQTAANFPAFCGNRYTCHLSAQYDAQNVYFAAHFTSGGIYKNIMPESTQMGFGGGDALQIRLNDGRKTVNLCGWFDTTDGKPALTADDKDIPNPFLLQQGAQEQFKTDADGNGYVQEVRVPWNVIFGASPTSPQKYKATFQLWFADSTPRFSFFSRTILQRQGAIAVNYKMPKDGQLTLGLFDKAGQLLKWIVQDEYRYAGDHVEHWDGLDQHGQPVAPGDYDLKALYHPPITTDYQMTVCNPGTPPWPTPDDKGDWLSDEATPQAVATDGKWVFLASPGSEKGFAVIGLDENGKRQWGLQESFNPRAVSLSVSGDDLYILFSGPQITDKNFWYSGTNAIGRAVLMCLDKKTGRPVKFTQQTTHLQVATWDYREALSWLWDLRNNKSFTPFNYGGQPRYSCHDVGESTDAIGMAVLSGKIYISMPYENKLLVLDADTGSPTGDDIPIVSAAGLCPINDRTLLAVSGAKIVQVDVATKSITPFITSGLVAPDSIAVDKSSQIYVSDWGTSFQVKAFDSTGRFLRAFGTPGGRPWVGKWDPNGMLVPRGVAVTDEGKLWVAEDDGSPKRVSVWNSASGKFVRDYIGPTPYGGGTGFWIDPKDPTEIHCEGARFKVDYAKKTYSPEAIDYRKADITAPFTPNGHNLDRYQVRVLYHGGHEYLFTALSWRGVSLLQKDGDEYKPVAAVGCLPHDPHRELTPDSDAIVTWDSDIMNHVFRHYYPDFFAGHLDYDYSWTDTNGDHLVQPEEMQWLKGEGDQDYVATHQATWENTWNLDISPDFGVFFAERFRDKVVIMRLDPTGWTPAGAPIYDIAQARAIITKPSAYNVNAIHVTQDNKLIVAYGYEGDDPAKTPDTIEGFDMNGKSLWTIALSKKLEGKNVHANCITYDYMVPGIGDVVCTWLYHGSYKPFFLTTDGLYVGTALQDSLMGPDAIWSESARYFYQSPDGQPYIINGANDQEHILKLNGLLGGGRFAGSLSIAQSDVDLAASMRLVPEIPAPPKPIVRVAWLAKPPVIDGDLSDWDMHEGVSLDGGSGRTAQIALGRDKTNLYLAYQVHEPTPPLVNGGDDWHDLYVSGDCVDLMLGTDPKADPHRAGAVAGDERLLFSVFQGQPIAVLYKPVVPGTTNPVHLAAAQVDQIIRLDGAKVAVKRNPANGTYSVEASVALSDLSISSNQKESLRGDVGVIYADESGKNRAERVYYYNKDTRMVADLPTETRLQPGNWGPIQFPLGPNLIQNGSFEQGFVDSRSQADRGWFVTDQTNGSDVSFSTDSPHSGMRSLLMETSEPVVVPAEEYDNPNYDAFIKAFNHGTGRGHAEIVQRVPVTAGHQYSVRYFYRNEDFQGERKETGRPRGYIDFGARIEWQYPVARSYYSWAALGDTKDNHESWQEVIDGLDLPRPYTAPEGAIAADIYFEVVTLAEGHLPRLFLDDIEFVDVTNSNPG